MASVLGVRALVRCLVPILLACGLGGCMVADSMQVAPDAEVACHERNGSSLGSYYLPKSYFEVRVYRWRNPDTKDDFHKLQVEGTYTRADPSRLFCLSYLASPTAKDSVRAFKTEEGVLGKISSRAEDQTADIVKKLLQTVFTLVIGFSSGVDGVARGIEDAEFNVPWVEIFNAQFDPTDLSETAFISNRLKDFGLCLISQDQAESRPTDPDRYCEAPMAVAEWTPHLRRARANLRAEDVEAPSPAPAGRNPGPLQGIFYRPRIPYDIFLFARVNRKVHGRWAFRRKATIDIENHAPIIAVGIDRNFFATRTTVLDFDHGVLTDVRLFKSSELQSVVEIPIYIAEQLWKLPANIVRFRIDQFKNEATLKRAETKLLQAELAHVKNDVSQAGGFRTYTKEVK